MILNFIYCQCNNNNNLSSSLIFTLHQSFWLASHQHLVTGWLSGCLSEWWPTKQPAGLSQCITCESLHIGTHTHTHSLTNNNKKSGELTGWLAGWLLVGVWRRFELLASRLNGAKVIEMQPSCYIYTQTADAGTADDVSSHGTREAQRLRNMWRDYVICGER